MHFREQKMKTPRHNVPGRFMISFLLKQFVKQNVISEFFRVFFYAQFFKQRVWGGHHNAVKSRFRVRLYDVPLAEKPGCIHNIHSLSNYKTCKPGFVFSNHKCRTPCRTPPCKRLPPLWHATHFVCLHWSKMFLIYCIIGLHHIALLSCPHPARLKKQSHD